MIAWLSNVLNCHVLRTDAKEVYHAAVDGTAIRGGEEKKKKRHEPCRRFASVHHISYSCTEDYSLEAPFGNP